MKHLSQVDIAPTIAHMLGISIPEPDGRLIEDVEGWRCRNVILVIVDSLGYDLYRWLEPDLKNITALANHGLVLRVKAVTNHTSPAIASILSGLLPEHHGIFDTESAKRSPLLSIPEIASSAGLRSADGFKEAALAIDHYVGEIAGAAQPGTMMVVVGDHPIHAGQFKRIHDPYCVALIIGRKVLSPVI